MKQIFILFLVSFLISFLITVPAAKMLALYLKIVDVPDGRLKKHCKATPYLGGAAIFVSMWVLIFFIIDTGKDKYGLFVGTLMVLITGLVDDIFLLTPKQKFICQLLAAIVFVWCGFYINITPFSLLNQFLALFWIVSLMNAFNLVDVMDGLAVTISISITGILMVYACFFDQQALLFVMAIFLGAQGAFFCYNRPRASIYLGDAGSMLLGATIAALTLKMQWKELDHFAGYCFNYLVPLVIVGLPLFEVVSLIVIRKFKKIPFYNGSADHFIHYLKRKKWSEWQILSYVILCNCALFGLSVLVASSKVSVFLLLAVGIVFVASWIYVVFFKNNVFCIKK